MAATTAKLILLTRFPYCLWLQLLQASIHDHLGGSRESATGKMSSVPHVAAQRNDTAVHKRLNGSGKSIHKEDRRGKTRAGPY